MDNFNSNYQGETPLSDIQSFYNDTTIFLTGGTGFVGNLILEKLLRSCSGLKRIYILIREKKGKITEERFKDLFNNPVFEVMKKEQPNYLEKISVVIGDCALPNLGIGEQYQEILKNEVNIVIHSAATVNFDEHLRIAVNINIRAVQDILKLSKGMRNLKSFVHISTAYSNCVGRKVVDEVFYKQPMSGDKLIKIVHSLDDEHISQLTPSLLKEWPNTYAMTKAVAEGEIITHGKGLPIGVVRPSMIIATDVEPVPGWINNVYGPTGVVAAAGVGLMRCMYADPNKIADLVPGDYVSNVVLASAWDIHNHWKEHNNSNDVLKTDSLEHDSFTPLIYNFVSFNANPLTWAEYLAINLKYGHLVPSVKAIWPIMFRLSSNGFEYFILRFLLHTLPAYIIDSLAKLSGKTIRLMDKYRKIHKFVHVISYFSLRTWEFRDNNTRSLLNRMSKLDQSLFNFDLVKLNWDKYIKRQVGGIRLYIIRDTIDTVPEGLKRTRKLYIAYYILLAVLAALFLLIVYGTFLLFL